MNTTTLIAAQYNTALADKVLTYYKATFNHHPILLRAPGRINLIGEHTDYNNGLVFPAAINNAIYFGIGQRADGETILHALDFGNHVRLSDTKTDKPSWSNYFNAIVEILQERQLPFSGVQCVFGGNIPVGAGLSSSAALCCGFLFGLNELFCWGKSRLELALIGQEAEHRIGLNCGLMDQYAVLFGQKGSALQLDCATYQHQYFPLNLEGYALMLVDSKVEHELVDTEYNARRADVEGALNIIRTKFPEVVSMREVTEAIVKEMEVQLSEQQLRRVNFVLAENQRVVDTGLALQERDFERVGRNLFASHYGLQHHYEVSCKELDLLVDLAKQHPGVLGARMMGGGFGGCTINLIEKSKVQEISQYILSAYEQQTGIVTRKIDVAIGDGVRLI